MAYRNTGYERSLTLTVTKSSNGGEDGPPVTYDGRLAFGDYAAIDDTQLKQLPLTDYQQRLEDFIAYVEAQVPGLDVVSGTDPATPARRLNVTSCPIGEQ